MANKMADKKKNARQSQMAELKAQDGAREQEQDKSTTTAARARAERKEREDKPVARVRETSRRESRTPSPLLVRLRSNAIVRFVLESYYELRHKVTWPTFEEARNMTIAVILLSAAVGLILGAVDYGFALLFLRLTGH